ncbi:MAG: thioredoxin-disulfide reductase [Clostridia bacterium]|nr:thioredoxin-disulfide reductase [Clostridia bacterium]
MYDLAIIGGGPAGLSAALYAGRAGLTCIVFEKLFFGGQMLKTAEIDNYPGAPFIRDVFSFSEAMHNQAKEFGAEFKTEEVIKVCDTNGIKTIVTNSGEYEARTLIIATGAFPKKLSVPGEEEFSGKGVSYCATCDGAFFKNKTAVVVGGGDTALEDALFLSAICETVYIVHRRCEFRGAKSLADKVRNTENIKLILNSEVLEIVGENVVSGVKIKDEKGKTLIKTDAVFIAVGTTPDSSIFKDFVALDKNGYIVTDKNLETSVPGVFAAGDVRQKTLRQIITAASDGAEAVYNVQRYILEN